MGPSRGLTRLPCLLRATRLPDHVALRATDTGTLISALHSSSVIQLVFIIDNWLSDAFPMIMIIEHLGFCIVKRCISRTKKIKP